MTANKQPVLFDVFAALFILSAPYLHFVDHHDFLFEYLNVLVLAGFALISVAGAALLRLASLPAARALFFSLMLLCFIDLQFDWFQWWGKKIAVTALAAFTPHSVYVLEDDLERARAVAEGVGSGDPTG